MKRLLFSILLFSSPLMAQDDLVTKRQNMEAQTMLYAIQLDNALAGLAAIRSERAKLGQDFQDSDFTRTDIKHMDAAMVGTMLDFVVPSFQTTYTDTADSGRNNQIILQMRPGSR